jgi:molybdopterin converting factor small subunit
LGAPGFFKKLGGYPTTEETTAKPFNRFLATPPIVGQPPIGVFMISVTVKLFAQFRNDRFKIEQRDYAEPISTRQILAELGIPTDELGVLMINNRHAELDQLLTEGDSVGIFPLVGGG